MWTKHDNYVAANEGWLIIDIGFYQLVRSRVVRSREYVENRAKEGSELHIKAIQHLALCKLLNISPTPKD